MSSIRIYLDMSGGGQCGVGVGLGLGLGLGLGFGLFGHTGQDGQVEVGLGLRLELEFGLSGLSPDPDVEICSSAPLCNTST